MKRSEMHDLIYEELYHSIQFNIKSILSDYDKNIIMSISADILDLIEEKKMLPPETICHAPNGDQYFGREWEPEE